MQRVFPLDQTNEEFLKITLEKFYRITGKSNQYSGITPDVTIPSLFDKQMPREDSMPTALRNDEIPSTLKYDRFEEENYSMAVTLSKKRIESSEEAKSIALLNEKIAPFYDESLPSIVLQFDCVFDDVSKINTLWKTIKAANEKEYAIQVAQNEADQQEQETDDFLKSCTAERIKAVKQSFHALEAVHILTDLNQSH
jgi:carboxyl-terminal processing protease